MIRGHYLHKQKHQEWRGRHKEAIYYDPEVVQQTVDAYVEPKFIEAGKEEVINWDLCDVGARGIQMRAFIGKSSMMSIGSPDFTIEYDLSNIQECMEAFVEYYLKQAKGRTVDSNPTRFQEEQFAKYGCE